MKNRLNAIGMVKIKILLIKRYSGEKVKLNGFLI